MNILRTITTFVWITFLVSAPVKADCAPHCEIESAKEDVSCDACAEFLDGHGSHDVPPGEHHHNHEHHAHASSCHCSCHNPVMLEAASILPEPEAVLSVPHGVADPNSREHSYRIDRPPKER